MTDLYSMAMQDQPVAGYVTRAVRGGYLVQLTPHRLQAFMPGSQIDSPVECYRPMMMMIIQLRGDEIVVSRRAYTDRGSALASKPQEVN